MCAGKGLPLQRTAGPGSHLTCCSKRGAGLAHPSCKSQPLPRSRNRDPREVCLRAGESVRQPRKPSHVYIWERSTIFLTWGLFARGRMPHMLCPEHGSRSMPGSSLPPPPALASPAPVSSCCALTRRPVPVNEELGFCLESFFFLSICGAVTHERKQVVPWGGDQCCLSCGPGLHHPLWRQGPLLEHIFASGQHARAETDSREEPDVERRESPATCFRMNQPGFGRCLFVFCVLFVYFYAQNQAITVGLVRCPAAGVLSGLCICNA